ncbi:MATE family efflux transporter [Adlercreutzia sp. ZJ473]|uniref:MATE family efflux transporter n=1 Tax=Adlercreutzia sp. ZJ473 TaxID=2722822 RepID=UPI0020A677D3|nr:MATE family efflux transporter [Adlercreutzia sp. ZJ473]
MVRSDERIEGRLDGEGKPGDGVSGGISGGSVPGDDASGDAAGERGKEAAPASKGDAKVARMGTASVPKLVVEFAIPSVVGMLVNGSYAIINSVFLGNAVGEIGLSAITVANPMLIVFMAFAMLVGNGGNALAALRLGEGRHGEAERALGNVVFLSLVVWVIVALAAASPLIIDAVLTVSSATDDVRPYARIYIQILCFGFIFQMIGMGVNNFIRTSGAPIRALVTMVAGLLSSVAFNFLFVMMLGWGIVGSACASLAGQALSCALVLWYFIGVKDAPMHLRLRYLRPQPRLVGSIFALGFPSFAIQAGMAIINFLLNYQLVKYGALTVIGAENALASIGVVQRIGQFSVMPVIGVAVAIQPLLGYNYGARKIDRVRSAYKCGVVGASAICVAIWACIYLFTAGVVSAFGITNPDLNEFTVFAMKVQFVTLPLVGFQIVSSNYFQATGQPAKSIFLSLTRQIVFLVPLIWLLPDLLPLMAPALNGLDALYFAQPVADALSICVTACFVAFEMRRLGRVQRGEVDLKVR